MKPIRGIFENLLTEALDALRALAENGEEFIYFDHEWGKIERIIQSFLDHSIVIIEDCAFSGTTIKSELERLKRLLEIVFVPYERQLSNKGHSIPNFYILLPITTYVAIKEIDSILSGSTAMNKYLNPVITGYAFDHSFRFFTDIPNNIKRIKNLLIKTKPFTRVKETLLYFHQEYSTDYWSEKLCNRTSMREEDCVFGYKKGGWPIITYFNSPNNSLPILWYPDKTKDLQFKGLFPRNESRLTHDPTNAEKIKENIDISVEDKHGHLKKILANYYEKY